MNNNSLDAWAPEPVEAIAYWDTQNITQPGEAGYWKVWGAQVRHIKAGDIVVTKDDDDAEVIAVQDTFLSRSHPLRYGFIDAEGGTRFTLGAMCPVVVLRWSTCNTLAE